MAKQPKKGGLGRGLSALMADIETPTSQPSDAAVLRAEQMVAIDHIHPNRNQPRRDFDHDEMAELTASIKERGVIQPIIVRPDPNKTGEYQIVAGERRWRASQKAQLHEMPVLIREMTDEEVMEVAIIENVQRADLNPVEEAMGYRTLMDTYGRTQEQVSGALGKSRSHIANLLRLLNLPVDVQAYVRQGKLTTGPARALIGNDDASDLAREIIKRGLNVREAEALVKRGLGAPAPKVAKVSPTKDADTMALEADLSAQLGMSVVIAHKDGAESGNMTIKYKDLDQLDAICAILSGSKS